MTEPKKVLESVEKAYEVAIAEANPDLKEGWGVHCTNHNEKFASVLKHGILTRNSRKAKGIDAEGISSLGPKEGDDVVEFAFISSPKGYSNFENRAMQYLKNDNISGTVGIVFELPRGVQYFDGSYGVNLKGDVSPEQFRNIVTHYHLGANEINRVLRSLAESGLELKVHRDIDNCMVCST